MAAIETPSRRDPCALSRTTRAVALAVAGLSCTVSLVLTVRLCLDLRAGVGGIGAGGSVVGDVLAVAIGVTWELAKVLFAAVGMGLLVAGRGLGRLVGLGLSVLATVLVAGSVVASMGFLAELDTQRAVARTTAATVLQDIETQVADLDQQISTLTALAEADREHEYRTRALRTLASIAALRAARADLAARRTVPVVAAAATSEEPPVFGGLAALLASVGHAASPRTLRALAHALLAVVLELIGIAAIGLLRVAAMRSPPAVAATVAARGYEPESEPAESPTVPYQPASDPPTSAPVPPVPEGAGGVFAVPDSRASSTVLAPVVLATELDEEPAPTAPPVPEKSPEPAVPDSGASSTVLAPVVLATELDEAPAPSVPHADPTAEATPQCAEARELIRRGEIRPTYQDVRRRLRVGQGAAREILRALVHEGVLVKKGHRYMEAVQ